MKLRVLETEWKPFIDTLCERKDLETAGIILAERLRGGHTLLARQMIPIPQNGYLIRRVDQLRLDPVAINRIIRPARDARLKTVSSRNAITTAQTTYSLCGVAAADLRGSHGRGDIFTVLPDEASITSMSAND